MTQIDLFARFAELQEQLGRVQQAGDVDAEIDVLLRLGELCLATDDPGGAHMHFKLAERVMRGAGRTVRLHEALGGQGVARRRRGPPAAAVACFAEAEQAARATQDRIAEARWTLERVSALRAAGDGAAARAALHEAVGLVRPRAGGGDLFSLLGSINLLDPQSVAVVVELEGQLGLAALDAGDLDAAEDHYATAVEFARTAGDEAVAVWATNLGNARARRRRYGAAVEAYDAALAAARQLASPRYVTNTALRLASCLEAAHRLDEAAERLVALADELHDDARWVLLDRAQQLFERAAAPARVRAVGEALEDLAPLRPLAPEALAAVAERRRRAEQLAADLAEARARPDGPTAADLHLADAMRAAVGYGDADAAREAADLVCDLKIGLILAGGDHWKRLLGGDLLSQTGLDVRAFGDALRVLVDQDRTADVFELLQRYKGPGFCASVLRRHAAAGAPLPEAATYVQAATALRERLEDLAGPAAPDYPRFVHGLRAAGEALRETGEALRERDPVLHARLGGVVRPEDLIDALPAADSVAIVDLLVGVECTVGVVILRVNGEVRLVPLVSTVFTADHAWQLLETYVEAGVPKALGPAQSAALDEISQGLHDRLLCSLARTLSGWGVTQLILVPDLLLRPLPLHLSRVCGKEVQTGVDTGRAEYLCEVMPVELAPCVQAVAASQVHRRPPDIRRISAFGDPHGDLRAARATLEGFKERLAERERCDLRVGAEATTSALADALRDADLLLFGTHGEQLADAPEDSHLVLADGVWALRDVVDAPELSNQPMLVLAACEIGGAALTPDDRDAYGIPGALLAAGASAVLANLWPVEDVTAGFLTERFLHHLGHPGYRPAAALFRAVRDVRRLGRDDALALCRRHAELLKAAGAEPRLLVAAQNLLESIEDGDAEHPLADPVFWAATVIVGSGWALPVGAAVGHGPTDLIELRLQQERADAAVRDGEHRRAVELAREIAARTDGAVRARALSTMALAALLGAELTTLPRVRRRARGWLGQAERVARAEDDEELLGRVARVRRLLEDADVAANKH